MSAKELREMSAKELREMSAKELREMSAKEHECKRVESESLSYSS